MIEISNVCKTYETGNKALRNVSITIGDGEFVFIMGRSGSGKSTLMKLLLKEVEPTSGKIVVNDMNLGKMPRHYVPKYRRRLGMVFQDFRLLNDRNVYENVAFAQRVIQMPTKLMRKNVPNALAEVGLAGKYKAKTKQLSGGEQQMLAVGRALMSRPKLLMLDEPSLGLAPLIIKDIFTIIQQIKDAGVNVLLIEQNAKAALEISDYAYVMETGNITMAGPGKALMNDERVKAAYLGE